jgi:hypothetical protein
MAIGSIKEIIDAYEQGRTCYTLLRKRCGVNVIATTYHDAVTFGGSTNAYYYTGTPLTATVISNSIQKGLIIGGGNLAPLKRYLHRLTVQNASPLTGAFASMVLHDYLLCYPFIDQAITDTQTLNNSASISRYGDGVGVKIMAVSQIPHMGTGTFTVNYTNSNGVAGRVTPPIGINTMSSNTGTNPISGGTTTRGVSCLYLPLQDKDIGVRSIESVTFSSADTGMMALVLVKPLATIDNPALTVNGAYGVLECAREKDFISLGAKMPQILDDAYLGFTFSPCPNTSAQPIVGAEFFMQFEFIWG